METIGSAERSTDKEQMRETFHTISDGQYAELLYKLFGKERVEKELDEFLEFDFFPRSGGGIGMQRLMSALSQGFQCEVAKLVNAAVCLTVVPGGTCKFDSYPHSLKEYL